MPGVAAVVQQRVVPGKDNAYGGRMMKRTELNKILENHLHWIKEDCENWKDMRADLSGADLREANLSVANLRRADLRWADLSGADLDYSCLPLWCGSLKTNFDDRQLIQIAFHLVSAGLYSKNASEEAKAELSKLIDFANRFHRVDECGVIESGENN